ncbi:DUF624 domain-containing protein [Actinomyces gaoshouyii]|uniref:DUF624 domain-containing protein n=1 Tax=Actinomyces gaoshouyii TaxID=1960083 RepID=A0A8H9LFD2_9ACTO|nr:DUF624 domain-containing protein [Actinomyces gaoshouyii]ARD42361.1 hypothetical protein B6G06_08440 [Actinomyces gaoshouyii]GGO95666.1 hypothetical protein GCM10011612_04070 [Actinomyces gaoshouyii]
MAGLLRIDSPFHRAWSAAADLVVINGLTLLGCLPVLTAGSALVACHRVAMEMARDEDVYTVRSWWRSFRSNLRGSLVWWLPALALNALMGAELLLFSHADGAAGARLSSGASGLVLACSLILTGVGCWLLPLVAFFDNSAVRHMGNAMRLAVGALGRTALCLAIVAAPAALVLVLPGAVGPVAWFMVIIGVGFQAYLIAVVQRGIIDRLRRAASAPDAV